MSQIRSEESIECHGVSRIVDRAEFKYQLNYYGACSDILRGSMLTGGAFQNAPTVLHLEECRCLIECVFRSL